jgi:hypothetical protein
MKSNGHVPIKTAHDYVMANPSSLDGVLGAASIANVRTFAACLASARSHRETRTPYLLMQGPLS